MIGKELKLTYFMQFGGYKANIGMGESKGRWHMWWMFSGLL
jgi:hypothetical protein